MKKILSQIVALLLIIIVIVSCDYVQDVRDPNAPKLEGNRKVLVEDYTGHKCGNCPTAADVLKTLESQYPGKVIPLAIHAGFFANTSTAYPTDFKTTEGTAYDSQFGISLAGNPNGLINRVGFGTGGFIKAYSVWGSEVAQMLAKSAKFEIKIKNTFNTSTNSLNTDIKVKSLGYNNGTYKLVVLLTQDSIIAEQLDYRLPVGSQTISNYEFNHVLRGAINSAWGDAIFSNSVNLNDSIVKSYANFVVNPSYNASKCHVIAYVYDADAASPTFYEVLQVEEEKVK